MYTSCVARSDGAGGIAQHQWRYGIMTDTYLASYDTILNDAGLSLAIKQWCQQAAPAALTLEQLVRALAVDRRRLLSAFRTTEGVSLPEYLRGERMRRAQRLLLETSLTVHQIAESLGFSSAANFSTAFRAHSGLTPVEFRRTAPVDALLRPQGVVHWQ